MAGLTGLEPAASRVTGERYNHLTTTPFLQKKTELENSAQSKDYIKSYTESGCLQQMFFLTLLVKSQK